jgi:hypothetical protein
VYAFPLECGNSTHPWYLIDAEYTLSFSALSGLRSMNQMFLLKEAVAAYDNMNAGKVRFCAAPNIDLGSGLTLLT